MRNPAFLINKNPDNRTFFRAENVNMNEFQFVIRRNSLGYLLNSLCSRNLVHTALLLTDVLHKGRRLTPVGRRKIKGPFEYPAIG